MRRVIATFTYMASWWVEKASFEVPDAELREGLRAYAEEHASMYRRLGASFGEQWKAVLGDIDVFLARQTVLDGR